MKNQHLAAQALPLEGANALTVDNDGWARLSGYGDFPNPGVKGGQPHLQRIDRAAGERLAANFRPLLKRLMRVHTGLPVFKGHPDAPGMEQRFPDKTNYGTIADVEARDDGIYVKPVITPDGSELVKQGWKFLSSFWNQEEIGRTPAGLPIASPFELRSVGLVLCPNIPGPAINSSPEKQNNNPMNRKLVLSLLTALGHAPAADISDADLEIQATKIAATTHDLTAANAKISADLAEATNKQTALTADVERLNKEKATLAANVATLTTEKETLSTEKAAALSAQIAADKSRLAAANTASSLTLVAANSVVTAAVLTGRIPASEKDAKVKELIAAANFGEEAEKIARLTPRLKVVERFSANLDKTAALDAQDRQAKVHAAVNSHMKETGDTDYTKAFQAVKADPKNATLFAAMAQPAANA